jgi:hypothetical protein
MLKTYLKDLEQAVTYLNNLDDDYTCNYFITPDPENDLGPFAVIYLMQTQDEMVSLEAVKLLHKKSKYFDFYLENGIDMISACKKEPKDLSEFNEDNVREHFNTTFSKLDDCKSAGSMYVGDNGSYILRYLDITELEQDMILSYWKEAYPKADIYLDTDDNNLDINIC